MNDLYMKMLQHVGHTLECVTYAGDEEVAIECMDCMEVIVDCEKDEEELDACECDNTHQQHDTVCRWCWAHGRRHWNDPEVDEASA